MKYWLQTFFLSGIILLKTSIVFAQVAISVDVRQILRTLPQHAVGMNMNYLMDGTFLSPTNTTTTTQTLKTMGMKMLRYPGGEKSDNYIWSSSPYDKSSPASVLTGNCQFPSGDTRFFEADGKTAKSLVLDFDEFMTVCQQTGAEPLIVCAYDAAYYGGNEAAANECGTKPTKQQLLVNAREWVRYANKTKNYGVKYWSIGNESWNDCLYNGCVSATQYALDIIEFATAMRAVDPTIQIVANGRGTDWWRALLQNTAAAKAIDFFSVSCYPIGAYTGGYSRYRTSTTDLRGEVQVAANALKNFGSSADNVRIKILATEFNAIDFSEVWPNKNDLGHALVVGDILGDCLEMSQVESMLFWNTRWIDNLTIPNSLLDALNKSGQPNANGAMLSVFANNLLTQMVSATKTTAIRSYAFFDGVSKVNIILINKELTAQPVNLSMPGFGTASLARWEFKGSDTSDIAPVYAFRDSANQVSYPYSLSLAPNSVTVVKISGGVTQPVPALTLTAALLGNGNVQLNWQNNVADDNASYALQRSEDGVTWSVITTVPADATTLNKYSFEDVNPLGNTPKVQYRVAFTAVSGQVTYSEIRTVQKQTQSDLTVKLLTNPVRETANFTISGIKYAPLKINLFNDKGGLIRKYDERAADGSFTLSLSGLPRGVYFFQFISPVTQRVVKAIKQ